MKPCQRWLKWHQALHLNETDENLTKADGHAQVWLLKKKRKERWQKKPEINSRNSGDERPGKRKRVMGGLWACQCIDGNGKLRYFHLAFFLPFYLCVWSKNHTRYHIDRGHSFDWKKFSRSVEAFSQRDDKTNEYILFSHNVVTMETSAIGWPPWLITYWYLWIFEQWRLFIFISRESKWGTLKGAGNPRCAVPAESHSICTDRRRPGPAAALQVSPTSDTCQSVAILMNRPHYTCTCIWNWHEFFKFRVSKCNQSKWPSNCIGFHGYHVMWNSSIKGRWVGGCHGNSISFPVKLKTFVSEITGRIRAWHGNKQIPAQKTFLSRFR